MRVKIDGVKNLKLPVAAEVEIKSGESYQKKVYEGIPLLFGLGARDTINTVRTRGRTGSFKTK